MTYIRKTICLMTVRPPAACWQKQTESVSLKSLQIRSIPLQRD